MSELPKEELEKLLFTLDFSNREVETKAQYSKKCKSEGCTIYTTNTDGFCTICIALKQLKAQKKLSDF